MAFTRIQVPVSDDARASLQALADARKCSLASLCGEILEQTAPGAAEMAKALELAKMAPARAMRDMADYLDAQIENVNQHRLDLAPKPKRRKYTKKAG